MLWSVMPQVVPWPFVVPSLLSTRQAVLSPPVLHSISASTSATHIVSNTFAVVLIPMFLTLLPSVQLCILLAVVFFIVGPIGSLVGACTNTVRSPCLPEQEQPH